jgi:hypothetical protein
MEDSKSTYRFLSCPPPPPQILPLFLRQLESLTPSSCNLPKCSSVLNSQLSATNTITITICNLFCLHFSYLSNKRRMQMLGIQSKEDNLTCITEQKPEWSFLQTSTYTKKCNKLIKVKSRKIKYKIIKGGKVYNNVMLSWLEQQKPCINYILLCLPLPILILWHACWKSEQFIRLLDY